MLHERLHQILPGLLRYTSSGSGPQHPVCSYILLNPGGTVVIDPPIDLTPQVLAELDVGPVADICVTHLQAENADGWQNFPNARLHVPQGDEYLCQGRDSYHRGIAAWPEPWDWQTRGNYQGHVAGAANERPLTCGARLDRPLVPGETVAGLKVIATPGHGKHAVTLLTAIAGHPIGFSGDLVYAGGKLWNWYDSEWDYGLHGGQRALRESACGLTEYPLDILCPTHGPVIEEPVQTLRALVARLDPILDPPVESFDASVLAVPAAPSAASGFRQLLPRLYQYTSDYGNCNVLISQSGNALLVDDGLCYWHPLAARRNHHRQVIEEVKKTLKIKRIEWVIPTHYHGDHVENIPDLALQEGTQVLALEEVADVLERPDRFNLACLLPWYGTEDAVIRVDQRVASGTRWKWHEHELEIFRLGGQTFHHAGVSVRVADQKVLFVGDSIGGTDLRPEPVFCYNDCEPVNRGWMYALDRMIEHEPDLLVCGHTLAFRQPMAWLQRKRELWEQQIGRYRRLSAQADLRRFFDPFVSNLESTEELGYA